MLMSLVPQRLVESASVSLARLFQCPSVLNQHTHTQIHWDSSALALTLSCCSHIHRLISSFLLYPVDKIFSYVLWLHLSVEVGNDAPLSTLSKYCELIKGQKHAFH